MSQRGRPPQRDVLTERQWQVLGLLRQGLTNAEIAERLGISRDGAKYHVSEILTKLGLETREQAALWRPENGPGEQQEPRRQGLAVLSLVGRLLSRRLVPLSAGAGLAAMAVVIAFLVIPGSDGSAEIPLAASTAKGSAMVDAPAPGATLAATAKPTYAPPAVQDSFAGTLVVGDTVGQDESLRQRYFLISEAGTQEVTYAQAQVDSALNLVQETQERTGTDGAALYDVDLVVRDAGGVEVGRVEARGMPEPHAYSWSVSPDDRYVLYVLRSETLCQTAPCPDDRVGVLDLVSGETRPLVAGERWFFIVGWVLDGQYVLLGQDLEQQDDRLYLVPATGAPMQEISLPDGAQVGLNVLAVPSPDGAKVAFWVWDQDCPACEVSRSALWVMDADGSNQRRLIIIYDRSAAMDLDGLVSSAPEALPPPAYEADSLLVKGGIPVEWSPDGEWLLYLGSAAADGGSGYHAVSMGGRDVTLTGRCVSVGYGAWSPDSRRVVVACNDQLLIADLQNRSPTVRPFLQADDDGPPEADEEHNWGPAWSPDGQHVAFAAYVGDTSTSVIYVANADGSGARPVIESSNLYILDWRP